MKTARHILIFGSHTPLGKQLAARLLFPEGTVDDSVVLYCGVPQYRKLNRDTLCADIARCIDTREPGTHQDWIASKMIVFEYDARQEALGIPGDRRAMLEGIAFEACWHCDTMYAGGDTFPDDLHAYNVEGTKTIMDFVRHYPVASFNFFSTVYPAGRDNVTADRSSFEQSMRAAEECILSAGDHFAAVSIFRVGLFAGSSDAGQLVDYDPLCNFLAHFNRFASWVHDRIPGYFDTNPLTLHDDGFRLNVALIEDVVHEAITLSKLKVNKSSLYHLAPAEELSFDQVIRVLNGAGCGITVRASDNRNSLNAVDLLFDQKVASLKKYFKSGSLPLQENVIPHSLLRGREGEDRMCNRLTDFLQARRTVGEEHAAVSETVFEQGTRKTVRSRYGNDLDYVTCGEGEPVVILNAYSARIESWKWIVSHLAKKYQVIVWEARGLLDEHLLDESLTFGVREQLKDLNEILANENIDRFHLITWCSGAKSAITFASQNPERLLSFCVIAGGYSPLRGHEQLRSEYEIRMENIIDAYLKNPEMIHVFVRILSINPEDFKQGDNIAEATGIRYRKFITSRLVEARQFARYLRMNVDLFFFEVNDLIDRLAIPTLIMAAQNDTISSPEQSAIVARKIPRARFTRIPVATHYLVMENPEEVLQVLETFYAFLHAGHGIPRG